MCMNELDKSKFGKVSKNCHMCNSDQLYLVLDLGSQPHSDDFMNRSRLDEVEFFFPLRLCSCKDCGLLQIDYFVNPGILYQTNYVYESSITKTGVGHYTKMAQTIADQFSFLKGSLAIDIGSNVGVLLMGFKECGYKVLGVDPASAPAQKAIDSGVPTIIDFFNHDVAQKIIASEGKAKVITGTNVFAHLHDIDSAVEGVKELLDDDGLFVIEAPYALDMIEKLEYDTIYHQHIGYLSVKPMAEYFKKFGLELFDVEPMSIHGGSLRYFVSFAGQYKVTKNIEGYIKKETSLGLYDELRLEQFTKSVLEQRRALIQLLLDIQSEGKTVAIISTPAKGNTLLNFCGIDSHHISFATERSEFKKGKYTPGSHLLILDDEALMEKKPDYALILAWNFAEEIMKNLSEYKENGGKFIIPIPHPVIK